MDVNNVLNPLFSVLIANYNNGCYLQHTIDSVLRQTYSNWEIVLVDDCSTDDSAEIYKRLETIPQIRVFQNEKNYGAGYAKRRCVELAKGTICGFVDPDDLLAETDALEVMVRTHLDHPEASMIYSGYYLTDENLVIEKEVSGTDLEGVSALESCSWPFRHFVSFKKEKYDLTIGIDPLMKRAVDYDMYYKLEEVGSVIHIDRILYTYRQNSHSISLNESLYKSRAWHSYTCAEAMRRRGLSDEKLMLFPIENVLRIEFEKGVKHAKSLLTYRVGSAVLWPLRLIRRVTKKALKQVVGA